MKKHSVLLTNLAIIFFFFGIINGCKKEEKGTYNKLCNKWKVTEIFKNDIAIPLNDSVRTPDGTPIWINGTNGWQPIIVYDRDSLIIRESNTFSVYVPLSKDINQPSKTFTFQEYISFLSSPHNGGWSFSLDHKKITVTNYVYEMVPGEIDILKSTTNELWLKQSSLEYRFKKL